MKAALELLPLHRQRRVEERDDGARSGGPLRPVGLDGRSDESRGLEEPGLDAARPRRGLGRIGCARLRIAIGHHFERVGLFGIERILDAEVFRKRHVAAGKRAGDAVRRLLAELQRVGAAVDAEVLDRVGGDQAERDGELARRLRVVRVGPERQREARPQILDRHDFVVLHLQPLRAEPGNRRDARAERRRACRFGGALDAAFALLQQARIDLLLGQGLVDLLRPATLEDDPGNARHAVPDRKVGHRRSARHREQILAFEHAGSMAREDLPDRDARVAVVDPDVDRHLIERQDRGIRRRAAGRNQHAEIAQERESARRARRAATSRCRRFMAGCARRRCRCRRTDGCDRQRARSRSAMAARTRASSSAARGDRRPAALSTACRRRHASSVTAIAFGLISIGPVRSAKRCQRPFASRRKSPPP